jgi:hypothetical protein
MTARFALGLVVPGLLTGVAFGQDKGGAPGNPPRVLIAAQIDDPDNLVLVRYRTIYRLPASPTGGVFSYNERSLEKVPLKGVRICRGDGKAVSVEAARKLLGNKETAVLASSWGRPLPPFFRAVFKGDVLLFVFPQIAPAWEEIQEPERPVSK